MQTIVMLSIAAFAVYGYICYYILTRYTERRSATTKNLTQKRIKQMKAKNSEREIRRKLVQVQTIADMMRKVWIIGYNSEREQQIKNLLSATDKRDENGRLITAEEIYLKQLLIAGGVIGVGAVIGLYVGPVTVLIAVAISPMFMNIVLSDLKEEQIMLSKTVSSQFLDFYKVYYVQYIRRDVTSTLLNIVQSYMPRADEGFKRVLSRFASDLESGEEFALAQLDSRFPTNAKVHKFVTIAKARNRGDDACFDSMRAFLNEMEEERDAYYENDLHEREYKINKVVLGYLMGVFAVIMSILIINMITGNA